MLNWDGTVVTKIFHPDNEPTKLLGLFLTQNDLLFMVFGECIVFLDKGIVKYMNFVEIDSNITSWLTCINQAYP